MTTITTFSRSLLAMALLIGYVQADLIMPTNAAASSALTAYGRQTIHSIDGSGMTGDGIAGTTCSTGESGLVWTNERNIVGPNDLDPEITCDLGVVHDVTLIREWGYNSNFQMGSPAVNIAVIGPDEVDVYTSVDGIIYTFAETVHFALAPGTNNYSGHAIPVNHTGIRYIKLNIMTNHDGAIFDGTGNIRGTSDGRSLTGLSEIRFEAPAAAPSIRISAIRHNGSTVEVDATNLDAGSSYRLTRSAKSTIDFVVTAEHSHR